MKIKQLLIKTLFVAVGLCAGVNAAWADDILVPTPVYFNDFSFATSGSDGIEIVGNGVFEDDADVRFGKIFHNDPANTSYVRTNYLKLPTDALSHSATSKEMTIGFWVNKKSENDFWFMPLFTAYGAAPTNGVNTWPMFACQTRGLLQVNCAGWCNFDAADNDKKTNYEGTYWLDDGEWHYYSVALTETTAKVYVDGSIVNSWTVNNTDGHTISGLFTYGSELDYVCLGGNQSWDWDNADPAFGFDDFAVYDVALSKEQIDQIRANKLDRSVTGTKVGNQDNSTEYLTATSDKVTLKPGESYHYRFINYNKGTNNHNNWILPVYNSSDENVIAVRLDNWEDKGISNAGCTSNFIWDNFPGETNGATVDMTVTFTAERKFTMSSTINTVGGATWNYSYTNDYTGSPIDLTGDGYIKVALSVSRSWLDITSEDYGAISAPISSYGWATFSSDYALDFSKATTGLEAYMITGHEGSVVTKSQVTGTVPAGTGLLLKGAEGSYTIPVVGSSSTDVSANKLVAGTGASVSKEDDKTKYVLGVNGSEAEFQKIDGTAATVAKGKAYLQFDEVISARSMSFEGDEITGIENVAAPAEATLKEGKFIENGQLVIVKNGVKFNAAGQQMK